MRVPEALNTPLGKIRRLYSTISSFSKELVHDLFRFDSREQLQDLYRAFRFPIRFKPAPDGLRSCKKIGKNWDWRRFIDYPYV